MKNHLMKVHFNPLTYQDTLEVYPFGGRKFSCNLRRQIIDIIPEFNPPQGWVEPIRLPREASDNFHYQLMLEEIRDEKIQVYSLRTKMGNPFLINGQWTKECLLEKGDTVYIGHSRLVFQENQPLLDLENWGTHPILKDRKVMESTLPVYIEGETGTGKSYLAQKIHEKSGRSGHFVHLNLSALSSSLIESELFGHKKGAFTGAVKDKTGAFHKAHQGTLFLDEIDSLSPEIQTKLLLFFDHQKITPVGSTDEIKLSVRVIIAAGKSLHPLVEQKLFRADLFFRLKSGFSVHLKPLRDDLNVLDQFIQRYMVEHDVTLSDKLRAFYDELPWPGNIRQLKSHLDLKREMAKGRKLDFDHWDEQLLVAPSSLNSIKAHEHLSLEEIKRNYVFQIYQLQYRDLKKTAKILNIGVPALQKILSKQDCR